MAGKSIKNKRKYRALKRKYDPAEVFQSDWYRHYRRMFAAELGQ